MSEISKRKVFKLRYKEKGLHITEYIVANDAKEAMRTSPSDNILALSELAGNLRIAES